MCKCADAGIENVQMCEYADEKIEELKIT